MSEPPVEQPAEQPERFGELLADVVASLRRVRVHRADRELVERCAARLEELARRLSPFFDAEISGSVDPKDSVLDSTPPRDESCDREQT